MTITEQQLQKVMPDLHGEVCAEYFPHLVKAMEDYQIDTPLRIAAFLAQIAHESGELRYLHEVWGPTDAQRDYEPHTRLSAALGNIEEGDGFRYRGRGAIQITGRHNYQRFGAIIDEDLENNPDLAGTMPHAFTVAAAYWKYHGLNELAEKRQFELITKKINGGLTGLAEREKYYHRALAALGVQ